MLVFMQSEYDVTVVGAGGSGLAAACSAARLGGRVLVLEKQPQPGGTTGIAVGSFTAAGTRWQQAAGFADDPADHAEDAGRFAPPVIEARNNDPLRAFFLREAAASLEWLEKLGLAFVGPSPEPPNRVARMHNVVPGAKAYIAALQIALARAGGELVCQADVQDLLREAGRVVGVRVQIGGQPPRDIRARRGVVLAAGDYAGDPDTIARHKGQRFGNIDGINPFAHGDGQRLAARAGAELLNMDVTYGPELRFVPATRKPFQQWLPASGPWARIVGAIAPHLPRRIMKAMIKRLLVTWQHPENALFDDGAILLNQQGERFVDETAWPDREIAVAAQPDKVAYILLDRRLADRYSSWPHFISTAPDIAYAYVRDYQLLRPDVTATAATLEAACAFRHIAASEARRAVAEFNAHAHSSSRDRYGRRGGYPPLQDGRWVLLGPLKAYFTTTEGGAAVNERLQALDAAGHAIPGLYAVGQNGLGGQILWGHGLHIAWAITSGRLAGRAVMGEEVGGRR